MPRVVSLVPSCTETLLALDPRALLVGRTRYCVEPEGRVETVETVGGTKDVDVARVIALAPDLVLANREENRRRDVERLVEASLAVDVCFPMTVTDGLDYHAHVAELLGVDAGAALSRARAIVVRQAAVRRRRPPWRTFCPIWMDPLMTVRGDTYVSDMLDLAGFANVFADEPRAPTRYPRVSLDEVIERQPDVILLPDEPHEFDDADAAVFRALPTPAAGRIRFVDGKDLSWFGARTADALARLAALAADLGLSNAARLRDDRGSEGQP